MEEIKVKLINVDESKLAAVTIVEHEENDESENEEPVKETLENKSETEKAESKLK